MEPHVKFARRLFFWAGVYGVVVLTPMYFLEQRIGRDLPPPISHPEYFYGFLGVALSCQFGFLVISLDVVRYRLMMLPAIAEKVLFAIPVFVLFAQGRVAGSILFPTSIDVLLAILFLWAYLRLGKQH